MTTLSRPVHSNQHEPHPDVARALARHRDTPFQRPVHPRTRTALLRLEETIGQFTGVVLDAGCGTGESTRWLAAQWPHHLVLGIDKSARRIARALAGPPLQNVRFLRLDLVDCWLVMHERAWAPAAQYLLYPNPWPKKRHLMRRWHAHPVMPLLSGLGAHIELRTNWRIYADEFALALGVCRDQPAALETFVPDSPVSAFERKYHASGHTLYRVSLTQ